MLRFRITNSQTYKNIDMKKLTNKLAQFKQWILSIVKPRFSQDLEQAKKVKKFIPYLF